MQKIINKIIKEECKIFGFKASNITVISRAVNEFDFITVHYDLSTSKYMHRYILLCLKGDSIVYKTSNCIDKDYFYPVSSCLTITKNHFKHMSTKLSKLSL